MSRPKLGDEGTVAVPGPVADARPGPGRAIPGGPGGHPPAPAVDIPPSAAGVRAEDRAQVVALWDNGWKVSEIAGHLGLYRQVVSILVGDLLRQREALRPPAPPPPPPPPPPPARPPAKRARKPRRPSVELVAVPLLTREGLREIAERNARSLRVIRGGRA